MDTESVERKFNEITNAHNIAFDLKEEQIETALSVLKSRHVIALLPTGFCKTLCILLPTMLRMETKPITFVISPLTSLIDDQMCTLTKWNSKSGKITTPSEMERDTISGSIIVLTYSIDIWAA